MNRALLRSFMVLHDDTNISLAAYLGITPQSLCNKINENGTEFKQGEIAMIKKRYNLTDEQVCAVFFSRMLHKMQR